MKIVYIHPHLRSGGVKTVILQQVEAIRKDAEVLVISGENPEPGFPAPHARVGGLFYDDPESPEKSHPPHIIAEAVASAIYNRWPGGCDIVHVHNPLLAKNIHLLEILDLLREKGFKLFLQVHDFAEDGRPESYYQDQPYPADCHYGTINSRDREVLETAGLRPKGVHALFNMVNPIGSAGNHGKGIPCALYPVRAIRRKNIGEAILLSLYFPERIPLAITLPPNSPIDQIIYRQWIEFAEKNRLNVIFEASSRYTFNSLVADAHFFITTSITEGFGFTFLEPWTAGKALLGRKLPEICRDFSARGIDLDHLYENIYLPVEWIDFSGFKSQWHRCIRDTYARYGETIDDELSYSGFRHLTKGGMIDFSMLGESFQRSLLARLIDDRGARDYLETLNPALSGFRLDTHANNAIESNRKAVIRHYGKAAYRRRLIETYQNVQSVQVSQSIDKSVLLEHFLQPRSFSLMKWCDNDIQ